MVTDFGFAQPTFDLIEENYGDVYAPPESMSPKNHPYDGEKADVFASAFVLLALRVRCLLPCERYIFTSDYYKDLEKGKPIG